MADVIANWTLVWMISKRNNEKRISHGPFLNSSRHWILTNFVFLNKVDLKVMLHSFLNKIFEFSFPVLLMGTRASADAFSIAQLGILPRYLCKRHSFHPLGIGQNTVEGSMDFLNNVKETCPILRTMSPWGCIMETLRHLKDSLLQS